MASEYYGLNVGQRQSNVVIGTSTNSTDLELRVNLSTFATAFPNTAAGREAVMMLLGEIVNYIMAHNWPPP